MSSAAKGLRTAFFVIAGLHVLIAAAMYFFGLRIPWNRFWEPPRSSVSDLLTRSAGIPVRFESLVWKQGGGLTWTAENVTAGGTDGREPVLFCPSAEVTFRFWPLLAGQLRLERIEFIRPVISLERDENDRWRPATAAEYLLAPLPRAPVLEMTAGKIVYRDRSSLPVFGVEVLFETAEIRRPNGGDSRLFSLRGLRMPQHPQWETFDAEGEYDPLADEASLEVLGSKERWKVRALIHSVTDHPRWSAEATSEGLESVLVLPQDGGLFPPLIGELHLSGEGAGEGLHPAAFRQSGQARGAFEIRNGKLLGANLIRRILDSAVPAGEGPASLPEGEAASKAVAVLEDPDTVFDVFRGSIEKAASVLNFRDLLIQSEEALIRMDGVYDAVNQSVDLRGRLILLETAA
ncbi:MAG: hypothetical protein WC352_04430, partial [Candidatus Omnitrophota bacterium]